MAITTDILESYVRPRQIMRRKLDVGIREDRALATVMIACGLNFVSQWPGLARAAYLDPSRPLDARLGAALLATVFLLPLLAYGLASLSRFAARLLGGKGSGYGARVALFWAMLAISPLLLLNGLVVGFLGSGAAKSIVGVLVLTAFLYLWFNNLREAEK